MRIRVPSGRSAKHLFPHHRQEHDFSCAPACLRMLAEWATATPQSEYRWRLLANMGETGVANADMDAALVRLGDVTAPALTIRQLAVARWRRRVDGERRLPANTVDLLMTDSHELDGSNAYHWMILLDLFAAASARQRHLVALLADPLADSLRCEAWHSLLETRVHFVVRIERARGYPRL